MSRRSLVLSFVLAAAAAVAGLTPALAAQDQKYPDVLAVKVRQAGQNSFDFDVTVSSAYDSPSRYADGIQARHKDGTVYGERKLFHDHASEQPFTRDMYGVKIPAEVASVLVQARDQRHGYGGKAVEVKLPGR